MVALQDVGAGAGASEGCGVGRGLTPVLSRPEYWEGWVEPE